MAIRENKQEYIRKKYLYNDLHRRTGKNEELSNTIIYAL